VIAGSIGGAQGPWTTSSSIRNISTAPCQPAKPSSTGRIQAYTAFIYVIGGKGTTDGQAIENGTLVLFDARRAIGVSAANEPLRFLLLDRKTVE
jgi:redox-sensitive bicupin YhaK (pirin superfamily)